MRKNVLENLMMNMFFKKKETKRTMETRSFEELAALAMAGRHYMDLDRLRTLHNAVLYAERLGIVGDIVECGVAAGCSAVVLLDAVRTRRKLWLYDTWAGMPPVGKNDDPHAAELLPLIHGELNEVKELISKAQLPADDVIFKQGIFAKTFQDSLAEKIAVLHIDSDWYDSVKQTLTTFYDRVVPGGVIIIDDYGYFDGVVKALCDFCCENQHYPLLTTTGRWQCVIVKDKLNNRDWFWEK